MTEKNTKEAWWKPAIEIFIEISAWVVVPILVALVVGKQLDAHFETRPWIFLGFAATGFLISSIGMIKAVLKYSLKMEIESNEQSSNQKSKY